MADKADKNKETYDKWHSLINMSQKSLDAWAEDERRLLASINREEAKSSGGIQSGYDSFHRIKRRKGKPYEKWTSEDFENARQEIGFNSRMLGGKPGEPVGDSGMSKWEISLRNWGHDPSLKSSPSYNKWKSWKSKMKKESNKQLILKSAQEIDFRRRLVASLDEEGKKSFFSKFIEWLQDKMKRIYLFMEQKMGVGIIHNAFKDLVGYTQKAVSVPVPKSVKENIIFKASENLGLVSLIQHLRDIYVTDTAESFDKLAIVSNQTSASVYEGILSSLTREDLKTLKDNQRELNEEYEMIKKDISREGVWYKAPISEGLNYLSNRIEKLLNRVKELYTRGRILEAKAVENMVNLYQKALKSLSEIEDSKIYGVKMVIIALKIWVLGVVWSILPFGTVLTLGKAISVATAHTHSAMFTLWMYQVIPTFLLSGSSKMTASSVRKLGLMLGSIGIHAIYSILKIKDFVIYLAKSPFSWLLNKIKGKSASSNITINQILRKAQEDRWYRKELIREYRRQKRALA